MAIKVKEGAATLDEIAHLISFIKENGGIEYAEKRMEEMRREAMEFIETEVTDDALRRSLEAYLSFVIERTK